MKMVAGLVVALLVTMVLLPAGALASFEMRDVITREAYERLVKSGDIRGISMTKTIISNPFLEEAIAAYAKDKLGGGPLDCQETCTLSDRCYTKGCTCNWPICYKNSLEM
uniref:Cyclotide n=1 Tax=Viola tricolor TaxID=214053 RepID=A0A0N9YAY2_9ROSI|nr:cyclotide precursor [Viola tricolor]